MSTRLSADRTAVGTTSEGTAMDDRPRFATLDAVLLGLLAIGTSLPFVADDASPLWSAPPTSDAAATKFAVVLLLAVLLWGALTAARTTWQGLAQLVAGVLTLLAVVSGDELGAGGSLVGTTAALAALAGALAALTAWRSRT